MLSINKMFQLLTVTGEQNKHRLAHPSQGFFTDRNRSGNRGYRCNRAEPIPVPTGCKPAQFKI